LRVEKAPATRTVAFHRFLARLFDRLSALISANRPGVAAMVLKKLGVRAESVRAEILKETKARRGAG